LTGLRGPDAPLDALALDVVDVELPPSDAVEAGWKEGPDV
jgi:hypothetical protein